MSKVAILGCGPAGLLAAHAAQLCGHDVTVFSKKQRSPMQGAQFMHVEIPDIAMNGPGIIKYVLIGSEHIYREKVYGTKDPDIVVSPQLYMGDHKCWDLRLTYARLWVHWERFIVDLLVTQDRLEAIVSMNDVVISTIPASVLCQKSMPGGSYKQHVFDYVPVWIDNLWSGPLREERPDLWEYANLVVCNGYEPDPDRRELTGWYRSSHIYNHTNTEWAGAGMVPENRARDIGNLWRVRKPISTDCDCWPQIHRAGRYGKWQKGILTHHAFEDTLMILS